MSMVANSATIIGLYWVRSLGHLSPSVAYVIMGICSGMPAIVVVVMKCGELRIVKRRIMQDFRTDWKFARWIFWSAGTTTFGTHVVPWLVLLWHDKSEVAVVGVLLTITGIIRPAIVAANQYLLPKLANHYSRKGSASTLKVGLVALAAMAAAMALYVFVMVIWGGQIVEVVYTDRYQGHGSALLAMAVAVAFGGMVIPLKALLQVLNRPNVDFLGSVLGAVTKVAAGICVIPWHGVFGASTAIALGNLMVLGVDGFGVSRRVRHAWNCPPTDN